jgi:hypothetical protein
VALRDRRLSTAGRAAASDAIAAIGSPHHTRSFSQTPDTGEALRLFAGLAQAPCPFSPVSASMPLAGYLAGKICGLARDFF